MTAKLKVVHINTADNSGGAARAAFHLHKALLQLGHESRMVVGQKVESRQEIDKIGFSRTLPGRILNRLVLEMETVTGLQYLIQPNRYRFLSHRFVRDADVIHLHNLHGNFFSFTILPRLSRMAPIVWTLHDTWPLTGHCSYNYDCGRWEKGCGRCPYLDEYPPIKVDTTALLWRLKGRVYRRSEMRIAAPSKWLADMARRSPLLEPFEVHHIPYGIDTQVFRPLDRLSARQGLRIPPDAEVVMIVALPGATRKGVEHFLAALHKLPHDLRPWILVVGGRGVLNGVPHRFPVREVGYVDSSELMNLCYSSADVFVLPTLADNLPLTLLEALAAGTPSVAFEVGGVSDVLRHMETGYLCRYRDSEDLARGIQTLLTNANVRTGMRARCRDVATKEYTNEVQARRYLDVYNSAVESR